MTNNYYIDTHAHLYREYYPEDLREVIQRAIDARVERVLLACVDALTPPMIAEAVEMFPDNIYGLIGLHPSDVRENYEEVLAELETHIDDRNIVGIGEIGLDYYHDRDFEQEQQIVFKRQLDWARDRHLPLSLHIRNGYSEAIPILNQYEIGSLSGVLHCFSGGIQEAEWAAKHGFVNCDLQEQQTARTDSKDRPRPHRAGDRRPLPRPHPTPRHPQRKQLHPAHRPENR